jgi:putative molybdopterin biosynthesis protein
MDEKPLYARVVDAIRKDILEAKFKPGDALPTVRELTKTWKCTPGTIQRAYHELTQQGLIISRPGKGTHVLSAPSHQAETPLRKAALIHQAESFLLEAMNSGHSPNDIEQAVSIALDRWRKVDTSPIEKPGRIIRFTGSHDLAITWLATHFNNIVPGHVLELSFNGSLNGLMNLAEGKADMAGCHLWDAETDTYNTAYIKKIFPNQVMAALVLSQRRMGLIVQDRNPLKVNGLEDLIKTGVHFINRQSGSGTRVWLDAQLHAKNILPGQIIGYSHEATTHNEVAQAIAEGRATVGLGLEGSARHYGLEFVFLTLEEYDLVFLETHMHEFYFKSLHDWLLNPENRKIIDNLGGYVTTHSGEIKFIR